MTAYNPPRTRNLFQAGSPSSFSLTKVNFSSSVCVDLAWTVFMAFVAERNLKDYKFSSELRSFDASKSGSGMGIAVLIAMLSALLEKKINGGLIVVGQLNLGGSLDIVYNALNLVDL